ncbi:hypothetical protein V2I01_40995 [Micromonospora sp. BRA006-A]|nr:hypothetical protein [Micromonospora sp. BRA006-A]
MLDIGAQDTGPDGGRWALATRGVDVAPLTGDDLVQLWTVRGARTSTAVPTWARWPPRSSRSPTPTRASASTTRRSR